MVSGDHNTTFVEEQVSAIHAQLIQDIDKKVKIKFMSRIEVVV